MICAPFVLVITYCTFEDVFHMELWYDKNINFKGRRPCMNNVITIHHLPLHSRKTCETPTQVLNELL